MQAEAEISRRIASIGITKAAIGQARYLVHRITRYTAIIETETGIGIGIETENGIGTATGTEKEIVNVTENGRGTESTIVTATENMIGRSHPSTARKFAKKAAGVNDRHWRLTGNKTTQKLSP